MSTKSMSNKDLQKTMSTYDFNCVFFRASDKDFTSLPWTDLMFNKIKYNFHYQHLYCGNTTLKYSSNKELIDDRIKLENYLKNYPKKCGHMEKFFPAMKNFIRHKQEIV